MASGKTIYISVKEARMIQDRILGPLWDGTKREQRIAKHLMDKIDTILYGSEPPERGERDQH